MEESHTSNLQIVHIKEVDSTNEYLKLYIKNLKPAYPIVVYADYQITGKGQRGKHWESEKGKNLLCSIYLHKPIQIRQVSLLSAAAGLAVIQVLNGFGIEDALLKWPNDIYINDKKLGGILIENIVEGSEVKYSIIGIGLNVYQHQFNEKNAVSLTMISEANFDMKELLILLTTQLNKSLALPSESIIRQYEEKMYKFNELVTFNINCEYYNYEIAGLSKNGNLKVRDNQKVIELEHHKVKWKI